MNLSGWARLWVVASAAIWIGGFFWLSSINYPYPGETAPSDLYPLRMPALQADYSDCPNEDSAGLPTSQSDTKASGSGGRWRIDHAANCRLQVRENWNYDWELWFKQSAAAGHLPLVAFAPLILGALLLAVAWVRRGFTKKKSPHEAL